MSRMTDFTVPSTVPGRTLHAFCCEPEGEVRAVLQLSHGMVEFIDRYKPLAEYLAGQGIVVVGHDHKIKLRGRRMVSPDIRAGIALLIAALSADGTSKIDNVEQIDRGYECIEERLNQLGAHIQRV